MKLFRKADDEERQYQEAALIQRARDEEARLKAEEHLRELHTSRGTDFCSSRGCKEETGVPCAYLDRRSRHCPTAWCPEHRVITHNEVYCPSHAQLIDGTDNGFGTSAQPDFENKVPMLVNWMAREMDSEIRGMIDRVAAEMSENVVVEPVRFVLFGVERVRTWERSWKVVSHHGVSLRVAIAVEEKQPDVVLGKMNSKVATKQQPPWNEEYPFGEAPATPEAAEADLQRFKRGIFMGLARPVEEWLATQKAGLETPGSEHVQATYSSS